MCLPHVYVLLLCLHVFHFQNQTTDCLFLFSVCIWFYSDDDCEPPLSHATHPGASQAPGPTHQSKTGSSSPHSSPVLDHPSSPKTVEGSSSPSAPVLVQPKQPSTPQTGPLTPCHTTQLQRGRSTCRASAPLPQLSASSESGSAEKWQPKRKGKAMLRKPSKCIRGEFATLRVRKEEKSWHDRQKEDKKPAPL